MCVPLPFFSRVIPCALKKKGNIAHIYPTFVPLASPVKLYHKSIVMTDINTRCETLSYRIKTRIKCVFSCNGK